MSQRLGSSINSPLFMADPLPVLNDGLPTYSEQPENTYLVKGDDTKDEIPDTYEHVGGEEDVFIINNQGGSFQLHRKTLRDILTQLKSQSSVSVRQLSPDHSESFRSIVEALRLLYGSQALYDLVLSDIRDVFSDVTDIKPGTVSAFFIGCFNDDKFTGPMGCSPKCAASLPPSEGTPGYANCDDLVLIYTDRLFSSLNVKRSPHAYIYIEDPNFVGFTQDNISQLSEAGIENASLVFGNHDGSYREITSALSLNELPLQSNDNTKATQEEQSNNAGVVFAVIILLIIVLLLIVLYRSYNPW
jgi:hypothetical protein